MTKNDENETPKFSGESHSRSPMTHACEQVRVEIRDLWSLGKLPPPDGGDAPMTTPQDGDLSAASREHVEACAVCRHEVDSIIRLEEVLHDAFRTLDERTGPPAEDRIASVLRRVQTDPNAHLLRRTRRSVRMLLWFGLFVFSLLGFSALILLALRALK